MIETVYFMPCFDIAADYPAWGQQCGGGQRTPLQREVRISCCSDYVGRCCSRLIALDDCCAQNAVCESLRGRMTEPGRLLPQEISTSDQAEVNAWFAPHPFAGKAPFIGQIIPLMAS